MYRVTRNIVLAYLAGAISNPDLLDAVEAARDTDPQVRRWFDLYDPDAEDEELNDDLPKPQPESAKVRRVGSWFVTEHRLDWAQAADDGVVRPPVLDPDIQLFEPFCDTETEMATLHYPAEVIPLGVARVVAKVKSLGSEHEGQELGSTLVVFRTHQLAEGRRLCVGEVKLADLGLSPEVPPEIGLFVLPATTANLAEFPREQVVALRNACNGDAELRHAAENLLQLQEAR